MMKYKPNQTRTYDGEGFKRRAACLCFRNEKEDEQHATHLSEDHPYIPLTDTTFATQQLKDRKYPITSWLCIIKVLLVSSSRHPDQWIVPGGGMEPEEEPCGTAVREVFEEAGVKGKIGRLLGIFEYNQDSKHRTYVYTLIVTETLEDWEDSVNIGRKRKWFTVDEALKVLQSHKPVHAEYLRKLPNTCSPTCSSVCDPTNNNNNQSSQITDDNPPHCDCSTERSDQVNR